MRAETDVVVVGGGVVGLATAAALAGAGRSLLLLERHAGLALETSSRNSEVIHAGLYDPPGSLKASLCVAGREALYERCARHAIPHRRLGKLVVACDAGEEAKLAELLERGRANGAGALRWLDAKQLCALEPAVHGRAALLSPETGIVDAHALCLSYAAEAEAHGATLLTGHAVVAIEPCAGHYRVEARSSHGARSAVTATAVVNAAGLAADRVAALAGLDPDVFGYRLHPCKGDYFALAPGAPLRLAHLVYPVPSAAGLGIHATLDLAGGVRFGPDAEYVDTPDLRVDAGKAERFAATVQRYLPALRAEWLAPAYAGLRPRLAAPGEGFRDFVVREESAAGRPGFVDLIGIESPGLTAAPAIAARVAQLLVSI